MCINHYLPNQRCINKVNAGLFISETETLSEVIWLLIFVTFPERHFQGDILRETLSKVVGLVISETFSKVMRLLVFSDILMETFSGSHFQGVILMETF